MKLGPEGYKKISTDEKSTTLESKNGHKVVIAHNGLSKKMLHELSKMPEYKKEGGMVYKTTAGKELADYLGVNPTEENEPEKVDPAGTIDPAIATPPVTSAPPVTSVAPPAPVPPVADSEPTATDESIARAGLPQVVRADAYEKSIIDEVRAKQQAAQAEVEAENAKILAQNQYAADVEAIKVDINDKRQRIMKDRGDGHIKQPDIWGSRTTGGKIGLALSMLLGGLGAGLAGGTNPVIDMLDKEVDRGLDIQKANLAENNRLLDANSQEYKDRVAGAQMTKLNRLDDLKAQVEKMAAMSKAPTALREGASLLDLIDRKIAKEEDALAKRVADVYQIQKTDALAERKYGREVAEKEKALEVPGPGKTMFKAKTKEGAEKARAAFTSFQNFKDKVIAVKKFMDDPKYAGKVMDSAKFKGTSREAVGTALFRDMLTEIPGFKVTGVLQEHETKLHSQALPDPTAYLRYREEGKLDVVLNAIRKKFETFAKYNLEGDPKGAFGFDEDERAKLKGPPVKRGVN